jgi:hypothetical protein
MTPDTRCFLATILAVTLLAGCMLTAGCLKEGYISVQDMDIQADHVTASAVTLNVTTYLRNTGGAGDRDMDLRLKAFNTGSGLLEAEQATTVPGIGWGETRAVSQALVLPRTGSYTLVATVYRDNKLLGDRSITVRNLDKLVPDTQQSDLIIDDMDFTVKSVSGGTAVIQADIYVANGGSSPSGPVLIEAKAKEMDARLTADKQQATIANIDPEKIGVASIQLSVPDQYNYVVDAIIWRNGTIVKRGEDTVQLRPGKLISNNSQMTTLKIDTSQFVVGEGQMTASPYPISTMKSPGFALPLVLLSLAIAGMCAVRLRRRHD